MAIGYDRGGLTIAQARQVVADVDAVSGVVAFTVAEHTPRQVMRFQQLLAGFPLL
ncbi:MAG: hypothetical protein QM650_01275 [Microlunatus sp.]